MQTYVLFQYSILRNIVSKTSESLIWFVVNLAFRFVYISHSIGRLHAMRYLRLNIAVLFVLSISLNNVFSEKILQLTISSNIPQFYASSIYFKQNF